MTKYFFQKYCNLIGYIEIEANSDKEALEKYKKTKISDYKWKGNPMKTDRTTYEVVIDSIIGINRKE
jgi:hypothetical protein